MTWQKGQSGNPAGRRKGSQNKLTVTTRALLWECIEQYSTADKSCNPFVRAVELLRDEQDPAVLLRAIDFLGDRLLPKLSAVKVSGDAEAPLYVYQVELD